ncbi:MAG: hypothetical protein IJL93_02995 [Bacteroidales bacterium]|nr:hypothetical protein [Bacteroidales bacterium]
MKRIVLALLACGLMLLPAQAQTFGQIHPNEISVSYGMSLASTVIGLVNNAGLGNVDPDTGEFTGIQSGGSGGIINLGYARQMNPYVSLGAAASFNRVTLNATDAGSVTVLGSSNIYTLLFTGKFDWFHTDKDIFVMYSKLGLGAMYLQGDVLEGLLNGATLAPAAQCSFICMEAGKSVRGFLELGLGSQGYAQVGIRARF